MLSMLVALIQAILTKTKQNQKEARNDDQLKPNLITFLGLFVCMWPVTEKVYSVTLVALVITDNEPETNSTS